jgi:hypothetical protein
LFSAEPPSVGGKERPRETGASLISSGGRI